jgi:beta-N-acetylhexosaminidase
MAPRPTVDQLLGKVLMIAPPDGWIDGPQDWLEDLQPAGIILFRRNLPDDAETARAAVARLHAWAVARGETLLVAMDEEGGFVTQTCQWFPTPPSARALAWGSEPEAVQQVFAAYGRRLRALGVNVDFAPVCDVNDNPQNPVIGVRSFGSDPALVAAYARAVHAGLREAGVLSCAKHFPGHGDTDVDSHLALPVLPHGRARLETIELVPFRALLADVPIVMVAHLACPELGDGELPATLGRHVTTDLLRQDLGFSGVAVTDAMDMQGVAAGWGVEEAAVRAMLAGCDLLLYCFDIDKPKQARAALRAALESGRLSRARLEEAAARVERLRAQAVVVADGSEASRPLPPVEADAARCRELCARALRVLDPAGWRALARAAHESNRLVMTGWPEEMVARLAGRLRDRGQAVDVQRPDAILGPLGAPLLVVLGERRPLAQERVALLRRLALGHPPAALANLLTPEIDAPLVESFTTILRTADASHAMLDVVAERILNREAIC